MRISDSTVISTIAEEKVNFSYEEVEASLELSFQWLQKKIATIHGMCINRVLPIFCLRFFFLFLDNGRERRKRRVFFLKKKYREEEKGER